MNIKVLNGLFVMLFICSQTLLAQSSSKIVSLGQKGKLEYSAYTNKGDILPDFSHGGYMGGGVEIPYVKVKLVVEPNEFSVNDSKRIQEAIDEVGKLPLDKHGFRGTVLLKKGRYNIRQTIYIRKSGIIVRGEGDGEDGTVLVCTKNVQYDLFVVGSTASYRIDKNSQQSILNEYVPSGTRSFLVQDASIFKIGDEVIVERPSTAAWIHFIGMDKIEARWVTTQGLSESQLNTYRAKGVLNANETEYDGTIQWEPGSKNLRFKRKISAIKGNEILVDIPITNAFQKEFGGGFIYKYSYPEGSLVEQVGVENLRAESTYNPKIIKNNKHVGRHFADDEHAQHVVKFNTSRNVWARNLTSMYMGRGLVTEEECTFATIQDCNYLDPIGWLKGGRRYGYTIGGQMCLVQRCYSRNARHDLAFSASVPGPNAFVDNWGDMSHAAVETHQRWTTGGLFDNCSYYGPGTSLVSANRGNSGTGHGWTGAQIVFWNCKSRYTLVMQPPTGQNFSIGNQGLIVPVENPEWMDAEHIQEDLDYFNSTSGEDFTYKGVPVVGNGYIEFPEECVSPQYLYYQQLLDRLGKDAVKKVTTSQQQKRIFGK